MVSHPLSSRLFPAGRLDFDATGLLLLTNDGDLANRLTHARYGIDKTYQMVVRGTLDDAALEHVNKVINQVTRRAARDAGAPRPAQADLTILAREEGRTVLELTSRDGRAVLVRDTLAALGHPVKKMERVAIGPVRLRAVAAGQWRELEREELSQLRRAAAGKPLLTPRRAEPKPAATADTQSHGQQTAPPAKRRRRRGPPERARQPQIAKRFRGIGQIVEDTARRAGQQRGGRSTARPTDQDRGGKRSARGEATIPDRRRGRTDAINAYRRKKDPDNASANAQRKQAPRSERKPSSPSRQAPSRQRPAARSARASRPPRRGGRP
jgi:pseudouridine synthase